ncbi:MAG: class aldolase/adducin family protein [Ramlibacter sp.]|nr:class aldolase/adducin family protein [Ramlibacter sp.]
MNESLARDEICRVGKSLFDRGYVHGTAGNISLRLDDGGALITPTDACLGFLDPAQLSRIDAQGRHASGGRPSKTLSLHARIVEEAVRHDPATRCVLHTHSSHCVSLSLAAQGDELLAPLTPYFVMKVGHVPHLRYQRPGAPEAVAEVAAAVRRYGAAGTPVRAVMLGRLGPVVWHESPAAAMAVLEELEETARLALRGGAGLQPLDAAGIDDLRTAFRARW